MQEYISFITEIKVQIKYTQNPIFQILQNYKKDTFLKNIIKKCLDLSKNKDFEASWQESFSNLNKNYNISQSEEDIIKNFAYNFGMIDIESQLNYCDYNISSLKPYLKNQLENKEKNIKLPTILAISISLIISIILI